MNYIVLGMVAERFNIRHVSSAFPAVMTGPFEYRSISLLGNVVYNPPVYMYSTIGMSHGEF